MLGAAVSRQWTGSIPIVFLALCGLWFAGRGPEGAATGRAPSPSATDRTVPDRILHLLLTPGSVFRLDDPGSAGECLPSRTDGDLICRIAKPDGTETGASRFVVPAFCADPECRGESHAAEEAVFQHAVEIAVSVPATKGDTVSFFRRTDHREVLLGSLNLD